MPPLECIIILSMCRVIHQIMTGPGQRPRVPSKHRFYSCLQSIPRLVESAMQLIAFQISYKICTCNLANSSNIQSFYDPAIRPRSRCRARGKAACRRLSAGVRILTATTSTSSYSPSRMILPPVAVWWFVNDLRTIVACNIHADCVSSNILLPAVEYYDQVRLPSHKLCPTSNYFDFDTEQLHGPRMCL